jgi:hypothetical protein
MNSAWKMTLRVDQYALAEITRPRPILEASIVQVSLSFGRISQKPSPRQSRFKQ